MAITVTTDGADGTALPAQARGSAVPSLLVLAGVGMGSMAGLWATSVPGGSLPLVVMAMGAWTAAGLGWLLLVGSRAFNRSRRRARQSSWAIVVAPLLVVVTAGSVVADVPLRARWAMSEGAFDTVVENGRDDVLPDQRTELPAPGRIGAYRVAEAYQLGDGVFFVVAGGGGIMTVEGFAHLPSGPSSLLEAQYEGVAFRALGDDWYAWDASV